MGMDDDGLAEGGRTRLARGTKPNALTGQHELAGSGDGAAAETGPVQAAAAAHARGDAQVRSAIAPDAARSGPVPAGMDARGSGPVPAGGAPGSAGRAPAQSICEAVEQLIEAQEAEAAVAEWMQGGG
jgi:hypothetical protein